MGNTSLRLLPLLLAAAALTAQTTWNVTSPLGIQPTIAAASPGDILVLTGGGGLVDYAPFSLDKGLTIRGNGTSLQIDQADVVVSGSSITAIGNIGADSGLTANLSRVTLRDVTVTGASSTTHPITSFPSPAALRSTTLVGGTPGGAASSGPVTAAPLIQRSQSSPWSRGAVSTLGFHGEPFGGFGLWPAPAASGSVSSLVPEPLYVPLSAAVLFGPLDATGAGSLPVAVPNVLSLQNVPLWIQALQVTGPVLSLRASTIAGGTVR